MRIEYLDKEGLEYYHNKIKDEFASFNHTHPIDSTISDTSTNPLENREVHRAIAEAVARLELRTPEVKFDTRANWDAQRDFIGVSNTIYIYTDYITQDDHTVAGIKVGDGQAYLIDLPFLDTFYYDHIHNNDIHITTDERASWNEKVRCFYSLTETDTLVFTTN